METSYISPSPSNIVKEPKVKPKGFIICGCILIATGTIALIGSLVAAGFLYFQIGYLSIAIAGGGITFTTICFFLSICCCKCPSHARKRNLKDDRHNSNKESQASSETKNSSKSQDLKENSSEKSQDNFSFPFISDIVLEDTNPLHNTLNRKSFLKKNEYYHPLLRSICGKALAEQVSDEYVINDDFLSIPLSFWINPEENTLGSERYFEIMNHPDSQEMKKMIDQRIEDFDQAIQLKERLKSLNRYLLVRDLLPSWNNSPIKYSLMMDNEIEQLTLSSIEEVDNSIIWYGIGARLKARGRDLTSDSLLPENIEDPSEILLVDLAKLTAMQINSNPSSFPPLTLLLIPTKELRKIETGNLSHDQLHLIFTTTFLENRSIKNYVELLKSHQINNCLPLIEDKNLFGNLSDKQILKLDISLIDQEIFNVIFDLKGYKSSKTVELLPKLKIDQIYGLSPLFSDEHWKNIGKEHTLIFDFNNIEEVNRQRVFNSIFDSHGGDYSRAADFLPLLEIDQIYKHVELSLFSHDHWKYLGEKNALAFDYSKIEETKRKEIFNIIFSTYGGDLFSSAATLLPQLPVTQKAIVAPYLEPEARKYLV